MLTALPFFKPRSEIVLPRVKARGPFSLVVQDIPKNTALSQVNGNQPRLELATLAISGLKIEFSFDNGTSSEDKKASSFVVQLTHEAGQPQTIGFACPEINSTSVGRQILSHPIYNDIVSWMSGCAKSAGSGSSGMPAWAVAALAVLILVLGAVIFSPPVPMATGGAQPQAMQLGQPPAKPTEDDRISEQERIMLATATTKSGIEWRKVEPGDAPFVIFSDPNCPSCKQLETMLAKLPKGLAPIIIPVAFRPGSNAVLERLYCASTPTSVEWHAAIEGKLPEAKCSDGQIAAAKQIYEGNNLAFLGLRLDSTPSFVAPNGKIAKGANDFDALVRWLQANKS